MIWITHGYRKDTKHTPASSHDEPSASADEDNEGDGGDEGGKTPLKPSMQDKTSEITGKSSSKKKGHGRYPADDNTGAQ